MDYPCNQNYIYILDDGLLFGSTHFVHMFPDKDLHIFDLYMLCFAHIQR